MKIVSALLYLGAFLPAVCAVPTATATPAARALAQPTSPVRMHLDMRKKGCPGLPTRDPTTCACLPGFDENGKASRNCYCPDEANTILVLTIDEDANTETASCGCAGSGQIFDEIKGKCVCPAGYTAQYSKKGILTCTSPRGTKTVTKSHSSTQTTGPTGGLTKKKRDLNQAVMNRLSGTDYQNRVVEQQLGCGLSEMACAGHNGLTCMNVMSDTSSCGGCPGVGQDCGSIPHAGSVACVAGQCVVVSCQRGYELPNSTVSWSDVEADQQCQRIARRNPYAHVVRGSH